MTIYMVQQTFARPDWEDEWNAWYEGNLKVLMSVPGFRTGQRFKAIDGAPPRYMAMYTVDSPAVFDSQVYKDSGGGGTASQRFRPAYQVWVRNLFETATPVPAVRPDECLVCVDAPAPKDLTGVSLTWMRCTGLHQTTPVRGIGVVKVDAAAQLRTGGTELICYAPLSEQLGPLWKP